LDVEIKFLKCANPVISKYLSNIFNSCFNRGIYPDTMKLAEIIPIYKKRDHEKTTNYRPISLLSQFNKIFEKLFYVHIYSYGIKFDLLSDCQFGFRKNSSTTLEMTKIYDELLNNMNQGLYSCCIFFDLSKAFEKLEKNLELDEMHYNY